MEYRRCWACRLCRRDVIGRDEHGHDETEELCLRYNQPIWDHGDAEHCEFFDPKSALPPETPKEK